MKPKKMRIDVSQADEIEIEVRLLGDGIGLNVRSDRAIAIIDTSDKTLQEVFDFDGYDDVDELDLDNESWEDHVARCESCRAVEDQYGEDEDDDYDKRYGKILDEYSKQVEVQDYKIFAKYMDRWLSENTDDDFDPPRRLR
jgi:hypothetical protein